MSTDQKAQAWIYSGWDPYRQSWATTARAVGMGREKFVHGIHPSPRQPLSDTATMKAQIQREFGANVEFEDLRAVEPVA